MKLIAFVLVLFSFSFIAFSQQNKPKTKDSSKEKKEKIRIVEAPELVDPPSDQMPEGVKGVDNQDDTPAEKSLKVDSKVVIFLEIEEGDVRINGWSREEVRAYVEDGSQVGFKVTQKSKESGKPNRLKIVGYDPDKTSGKTPADKIFGRRIEIDAPYNSIVAVKSRDGNIVANSLAKIDIESVGGDVSLSSIKYGIKAMAYQGDLIVQNSGGPIELEAFTGNLTVSEVEPSNIDDFFKARTQSGIVSLKSIGHLQVEVKSISGLQKYEGAILEGAQYDFNTSNGRIFLFIPKDSSCRIDAFYGQGGFKSDFMLKDVVKAPTAQGGQKMTAVIGTGNANLRFVTVNGFINVSAKSQ